jgi:phenylacetic acid degradation operon negative regulatory protein
MATVRNAPARDAPGLRPLSARSLVLSLLLGMHPPRLAAAELVRWCVLFGVEEGTARTALSRMAAAGELRVERGRYELAGRVLGRQRQQDAALAPSLAPWRDEWVVAVVTADDRSASARSALRAELAAAHYAEQREGVWTRPDNLGALELPERDRQCRLWRATPDGDPRELAGALWDLDGWAAGARHLVAALERHVAALTRDGASSIPDAFRAGAEVLAQVRRDPLLPDALLPRDWPGPRLRAAYGDYQPRFASAVRAWRVS